MKKGFVPLLLLGFIVVVFIILLFVVNMVLYGFAGKTETRVYVEDLYMADNALYAAEAYTHPALRYSTYQACHDGLRMDDLLDEAAFKGMLASEIGKNFKRYVKEDYVFMRDYTVRFPEYTVTLDPKPDSLAVSASGPELVIDKAEVVKEGYPKRKFSLKKDAGITETINTNCWGLYQKGLAFSKTLKDRVADFLGKKIEEYKFPDKAEGRSIFRTEEPDEYHYCNLAFGQARPDPLVPYSITGAGYELNTILAAAKEFQIDEKDGDYRAQAQLLDSDVRVEYKIVGDIVNLPGNRVDVTCEFTYLADVTFDVTITGPVQHFPVWNGKEISFEPLEMKFKAKAAWSSAAPAVTEVPPGLTIAVTGPGTAALGEEVTFTADVTGGEVAKYEWDFDSDGTVDFTSTVAAANTGSHTYTAAGAYTAKVSVTDAEGAVAEGSAQIEVAGIV